MYLDGLLNATKVGSPVPYILQPQVRIPTTPSVLFGMEPISLFSFEK